MSTTLVHQALLKTFKMLDAGVKKNLIDYAGNLNYDDIGILLAKLKQEMDNNGFRLGAYKKVLSVMVECLENIYKYMDNPELSEKNIDKNPYFRLFYKDLTFTIESGNPILNFDIETLKNKIDKVNFLPCDELKSLYKKIITDGHFTTKGGAGLGFIEILKTTGVPLEYNFEYVDESLSVFNLKIKIPINLQHVRT